MRRLGIAGLLLSILASCGQLAEPANNTGGFVKTLAVGGWTGQKYINTNYPGEVREIAVDPSGGIFALVGLVSNNTTLPYLVKYSASGQPRVEQARAQRYF